jgi:hypothetical protein
MPYEKELVKMKCLKCGLDNPGGYFDYRLKDQIGSDLSKILEYSRNLGSE